MKEAKGQDRAVGKKGESQLRKTAREKSNLLDISLDLFEKMTSRLDIERMAGILSMSMAGNLGLSRVAVFSLGLEEKGFDRAFSLGTGPGFKSGFIDYVEGFVKWADGAQPPVHLDNFFTSGAGVTVRECVWLEDFINAGFAHVSPLKSNGRVTALIFYGGRLDGSGFEGYSKELLRLLLRTGSAAMSAALVHRAAVVRFRRRERFAAVKESYVTRNAFEIKTPLTVLKSAIWSIDSESASEGLMVDMARDALKNLEDRINELADISELRRDGANMRIEKTEMSSLVEETLRDMIPEIEEKGITVDFNERTLREIPLDPAKIRISISSILSGAVKNIPRGGEMKVSVSVHDSGPAGSEGMEIDRWSRSAIPSGDMAFLDSVGKPGVPEGEGGPSESSAVWLETRIRARAGKSPLPQPLHSLFSDGESSENQGFGFETDGDGISLALKIIYDHGGRVFIAERGARGVEKMNVINELETEGEWELSIWLPEEI